jgi:hypothetical protein
MRSRTVSENISSSVSLSYHRHCISYYHYLNHLTYYTLVKYSNSNLIFIFLCIALSTYNKIYSLPTTHFNFHSDGNDDISRISAAEHAHVNRQTEESADRTIKKCTDCDRMPVNIVKYYHHCYQHHLRIIISIIIHHHYYRCQ